MGYELRIFVVFVEFLDTNFYPSRLASYPKTRAPLRRSHSCQKCPKVLDTLNTLHLEMSHGATCVPRPLFSPSSSYSSELYAFNVLLYRKLEF